MNDIEQLVAIARFLPAHRIQELIDVARLMTGIPANNRNAQATVLGESQSDLGTWLLRLTRNDGRTLSGQATGELVDASLLNKQGMALAEGWDRAKALNGVASDVAGVILRRLESFFAGDLAVEIDAESVCGYRGTIATDDLPDLEDTVRVLHGDVWDNDARKMPTEYRQEICAAIQEAVMGSLAQRGVIRGPCRSCGRPAWVPMYVPKKPQGGRRPLSDTLCPACETEHVQRREASRQRTKWAKTRDKRQI